MSGTSFWLDWSGVATLEEGRQYGICVTGEYSLPNDSIYFPDGANSCTNGTNEGKRTYTTIDRTKPTTSVVAAGGAQFTKAQSIPLSIGFQGRDGRPLPDDLGVSEGRSGSLQRVRVLVPVQHAAWRREEHDVRLHR